jgi:hypothetical protein
MSWLNHLEHRLVMPKTATGRLQAPSGQHGLVTMDLVQSTTRPWPWLVEVQILPGPRAFGFGVYNLFSTRGSSLRCAFVPHSMPARTPMCTYRLPPSTLALVQAVVGPLLAPLLGPLA